jgi:hypothetical protein
MGKNMKKWVASAMALTAMAGTQQALAQSQVSIYGIIDTGVVCTNHANAAGNSVLKMPSLTSSFPSRLGFKGTEDLGGGLQAMFVLESGFSVDTGAMGQGNRLFGRQSYVGLKDSWGSLMLGRQVNMTYLGPVHIQSVRCVAPRRRAGKARVRAGGGATSPDVQRGQGALGGQPSGRGRQASPAVVAAPCRGTTTARRCA